MTSKTEQAELIAAARAATAHAHAPYSRYHVGAALRLKDGTIIAAANFENASYGLTLCAETVAVAKAASEGRLGDVVGVAIIGGRPDGSGGLAGGEPVHPCGRCRQVLNEAADMSGVDLSVVCVSGDGSAVMEHRLSDLLPHAFGPKDLGLG